MDISQIPAWLHYGQQAMKATIPPRTRKQFAALMLEAGLWHKSRLSLDSAIAKVGDCLEPEKGGGQRFSISELWLWMRETGHCALFEAMGEDLGRRTDPIPSAERQQALLQRIDEQLSEAVTTLTSLQTLRAQLTGTPVAASPLRPLQAVRFSQYDETEGF
jgi:hypothetical protein